MSDHEDGLKDFGSVHKMRSSEKTDALEVINNEPSMLFLTIPLNFWCFDST